MPVMMGLRMKMDPARFEQVVGENSELVKRISGRGKEAGAIHHAFYANDDDGEVLVVDQWPDRESFLSFFNASMDEIGALMGQAGLTDEPKPVFWRELDTPDKF